MFRLPRFHVSVPTAAIAVLFASGVAAQEIPFRQLQILKGRSATENVVSGRIVQVQEARLDIAVGDEALTFLLRPQTAFDADDRPVTARELLRDTRVQVYYDPRDPRFASRVVVGAPPPPPDPVARIDFSPVTPVALGAELETTPEGLLVRRVEPDSPAEYFGLLEGDRILQIDGRHVSSAQGFHRMLHTYPAGERVEVVILRDDQEIDLPLTLPRTHRPERLRERNGEVRRAARPDLQQMGDLVPADEIGWILEERNGTVTVASVEPQTPAAAAKLQRGDVIASVNGEEVHFARSVHQLLRDERTGRSVTLMVRRGGERFTTAILVPDLPVPHATVHELYEQQATQRQMIEQLLEDVRALRAQLEELQN